MSAPVLTPPPGRASARRRLPVERLAALPWWGQVLLVWLGTRAVSAVVLLAVARTQEANPWTDASPSYAQFTGLMWDASWYREIAEVGYPAGLPHGPDGLVSQNAWAFFPLFPMLARGLMLTTGAPWDVVAPTLALLLGTAAALVLHRVLATVVERGPLAGTTLGGRLPLATLAVLGVTGAAPVLQVAYTESLALLLLAAVLWFLVDRQYLLAAVLLPVLGLSRAVALPVAVAVVAHAVARFRTSRADDTVVPRAEWASMAVATASAVAAGVLWPVLVGLRTGTPDAYTQVQSAWRGRGEVVPLVPWVDVAQYFAGAWWLPVLVVVVGLGVLLVVTRPLRLLGAELWGWTAGYLAYLLVAIEPGTSLVRFLVLAFPAAAVLAMLALRWARWRWALAALLVGGLITQVVWVVAVWRLVPPSGWPP